MAAQAAGTIIEVDPTTLTIATNVRTTVTVEKDFVASVKEHGILQPPMVTTSDTGYDVVFGQRRVLAAIEAGLTLIPAYLVDKKEADTARVIDQLTENDQREQLTDAERIGGYKQLALAGLSINVIAKKTGAKRLRVEKALKVADSPAAEIITALPEVTLDQAAIITEFDDDPEAIEVLGRALAESPARLGHLAEQIRKDRARKMALADAVTMIEAAGLTAVDPPADVWAGPLRPLRQLYTTEKRNTHVTEETHTECPGRVAFPEADWDWSTERFTPGFVEACSDWKAHGHYLYSDSASGSSAPLSDEEKEARKLARENNKLWVAATAVRTTFIKELLQRKDLPTGWELVVARYISSSLGGMDYRIRSTVENLFDIGKHRSLEAALAANPNRAGQLALAAALGDIEGSLEYGKSGWKHPYTPQHLRQLSAWGYTLSELEETLATQKASKR